LALGISSSQLLRDDGKTMTPGGAIVFGANLEGTVDDLGMLQADDIQHSPTVREHVFPCANPRVQTVASLENVSPRRWGAKHWAEGLKNVIIRYIRKTITMPS
jgi:hypothetical protein